MLAELIPQCPRLHRGAVIPDDCQQGGREWVCRICGTRLYGDNPTNAKVAEITHEKVYNEGNNPYRISGKCGACGGPSDNHLLCRKCRRKNVA